MKANNINGSSGFTMVEIMIVVAIIGLLAAIAVPNFARARETSHANTCVENLRQIDSAIQQWALETGQASSLAADPAQLVDYLSSKQMPKCPTGADYEFSESIGSTPAVTCPVGDKVDPAHMLPESLQ